MTRIGPFKNAKARRRGSFPAHATHVHAGCPFALESFSRTLLQSHERNRALDRMDRMNRIRSGSSCPSCLSSSFRVLRVLRGSEILPGAPMMPHKRERHPFPLWFSRPPSFKSQILNPSSVDSVSSLFRSFSVILKPASTARASRAPRTSRSPAHRSRTSPPSDSTSASVPA